MAAELEDSKRPNIVLLFADDLGIGDTTYRRERFGIPHITRLAADGMTFTDAYAASPTCSPSRASIVTGQHPARLRLVRHIPDKTHGREFHLFERDPAKFPSRNWLPLEEMTIAEALKPQGYRCAFVGKWHLGDEPYFPIHQGFDEQHGVTVDGHPRSYYPPYFRTETQTYADVPKDKYLTDKLTDDAVAFIERQNGKQPFLLTLFYYTVHAPYVGRKDLVEKFKAKRFGRRDAEYAGMVGALDESVGRVRAALAEQDLAGNTVVFFVGDQGGAFPNKPLRGGKKGGTALYEGGARVPFTVVWPGVTAAGSESAVPVSTTDVFPTMLQMAGGAPSRVPKLDGLSLAPLLKGQEGFDRDEVFLYRSYEDQYAAVRAGDWKLIAYRSGKAELYNVKEDLSEERDMSSQKPELLKGLQAKLAAWEKRTGVAGE
ncbi:sulfatase [bacterium]|nr:sulfatase [bacterium]